MYPVSDAFLRAVRSNTRKYFWTGTIITKGGMTYEFGAKEIVKGSGYISRQCCGSTEIELGMVYAAEMGITFLSDIDRYTLEDAQVTVVGPFGISGTSALVGAMKAYSVMTGKDISESTMDAATDELVTTAELADSIGDSEKVPGTESL